MVLLEILPKMYIGAMICSILNVFFHPFIENNYSLLSSLPHTLTLLNECDYYGGLSFRAIYF